MSSVVSAQDQVLYSNDALDELSLSRDLLNSIEVEVGRHGIDLIEPLELLADRLMNLNQFDEADELLDRAIQITRFHNGLHTPAQLSLINKRIDNFSNRYAWDAAREQMDYLFEYYFRVPVILDESLLSDFMNLAEQHLRGASEDSELEQGRHLSRVYQLDLAMISTARKLYGENSPLIAPYLYRHARHYYLFKKGLDEGGRARARSNFYYFYGGDFIRGSNASIEKFYFEKGLVFLEQIRDLFVALDPPDPLERAMGELYIADWYMLFDSVSEASASYERVYSSLLAAGVSPEQLNAFFDAPRILPMQHFYASPESALNSVPKQDSDPEIDFEVASIHQLEFREWSPDYPAVRSPSDLYTRSEEDSTEAVMEFRLAAENESTFLYKNRFKRSIGTAFDVKIVEGFRGATAGSEKAAARMEQLRFRPKMIDGKPAESLSRLRYEIAARYSR